MDQKTRKACDKYEAMLLKAAEYSGNKEPGQKKFSASMLGNDVLQNFLKFKYGSQDGNKFEANTLGSIYQLGVDEACEIHNAKDENYKYVSAQRLKQTLSNGWEVSGEMDQFCKEFEVIFDNKVTTATAIGKVPTEGKEHGYALQMGVYKWLMFKEYGKLYPAVLPMVDKGYSYFKTNKTNQLNFVEVDTYSPEEIETKLLEATNELQHYIDLDITPERCHNVWPMKRKGEAMKPMRCIHYCDNSMYCPHYSSGYHDINDLMDL